MEGENSNLKKRCAFIIELASRTFKLTPQRETDMQSLVASSSENRGTTRQDNRTTDIDPWIFDSNMRRASREMPWDTALYDRILNRKMSQDGSSSDPDVPMEEDQIYFCIYTVLLQMIHRLNSPWIEALP